MMEPIQGSCLAGLTHLGAAFLVLLGFALVLLAYKVVSTHVTTSELGWRRATYPQSSSPGGQEKCWNDRGGGRNQDEGEFGGQCGGCGGQWACDCTGWWGQLGFQGWIRCRGQVVLLWILTNLLPVDMVMVFMETHSGSMYTSQSIWITKCHKQLKFLFEPLGQAAGWTDISKFMWLLTLWCWPLSFVLFLLSKEKYSWRNNSKLLWAIRWVRSSHAKWFSACWESNSENLFRM